MDIQRIVCVAALFAVATVFGVTTGVQPADAVDLGFEETPDDGMDTEYGIFRSLGAGGWIEHGTVTAADGNGSLGVTIDVPNLNSASHGSGYVWYFQTSDVVTGLGSPGGVTTMQPGWVFRHSAWVAEDVNDPMLTDGADWNDAFRLEFTKGAFNPGNSNIAFQTSDLRPAGPGYNFLPTDCDLNTGTCATPASAPLPYAPGNSGPVNGNDWTQFVEVI